MVGQPTRPGFHTITPYLMAPKLSEYLAFLHQAFGAQEHFRATGDAGGTHVEVRIGDSMLMVSEGAGNTPLHPAMLFLYLEDVDRVYAAALAAGATLLLPPGPNFGEPRGAGIKDPAGHDWYFAVWESRPDAPPAAAESTASDVVPMLTYEDGPAALDWLAQAFGFQETERWLAADGRLDHGEMRTGRGRIMLSSVPGYEHPKHQRERSGRAEFWAQTSWVLDGVLIYVENVDQHYARAQAAGATILSAPMDDGPGRLYRAEDPEGHRWMFLQAAAG